MADDSFLAKATGFLGLYTLYVFLAGYAFFQTYYGTFGIDPRWLDLGFADISIRGFTALFVAKGGWLWPIYIFVIVSPIMFELTGSLKRKSLIQAIIVAILLGLFPATYFVAERAGDTLALKNKGDQSSLPYVTFLNGQSRFGGRLLLIRAGMIFVHGVTPSSQSGLPDTVNLHVYKTEEIRDIQITERPR